MSEPLLEKDLLIKASPESLQTIAAIEILLEDCDNPHTILDIVKSRLDI